MKTPLIALAASLLASGVSAAEIPKKQQKVFVSGILCSQIEPLKKLLMDKRNDLVGVDDAAMREINRPRRVCEDVRGTYVFLNVVGEMVRSDGHVFGIIAVRDPKTRKRLYRTGLLPGWGI